MNIMEGREHPPSIDDIRGVSPSINNLIEQKIRAYSYT